MNALTPAETASVTDEVLLQRHGHTLLVTLNRPQARNAMTHSLMDRLRQVWSEVREDESVRAIVVTGAGKGFCAGADVSVLESDFEHETAEGQLSFLPGPQVDVPVIAAVNGVTAGGGLFFVADADIAISSAEARFLDGHTSVGQVSGLGPMLLSNRAQWSTLSRMALLGRYEAVGALQAKEAGIVSEVVEPEDLLERALELATFIGRNSPEAVRLTRRSLRAHDSRLIGDDLEAAWELVRHQRSHPDAVEGPRAFREKREPLWTVL